MVTTTSNKNGSAANKSAAKRPNGSSAARKASSTPNRKNNGRFRSEPGTPLPGWLSAAVSVIGVGVAVGAGLYATRHQWMPKTDEWRDDFSAAFADDETDHENFDQTRGAGIDAMRDHPGEDWEDVDDMSDASFPASDPPSFNPGRA